MDRHRQQQHSGSEKHRNHAQLQDGFQELFDFRGHRLQVRGFNTVESLEDTRRVTEFSTVQNYVSWDAKQVVLWNHNSFDANSRPVILNQVKFSNQPNYICAIVHVLKMKVFLAPALDMSFKIFDNHLHLLESIHHDERAILQMEYDSSKDLIFTSGASGIAAWRLYRNLSADKAHIMEKLYVFAGCDSWITNMIYQPQFNRIYAVKESTVQVISTTRRAVVTSLDNIHDAPINVVCWYERNQFYLTGCSRGEIKCWTINYNHSKDSKSSTLPSYITGNQSNQKKFALLHTFHGHTKGVTAIHLHPISGLAISTSLDGQIRVLNLEALNELFSIQIDAGIINMRIVKLCNNQYGCLASLTDASIRIWKITSVCDFFAVASSKISGLEVFENLEGELVHHHQLRQMLVNDGNPVNSHTAALGGADGRDPEMSVIQHLVQSRTQEQSEAAEMNASTSADTRPGADSSSRAPAAESAKPMPHSAPPAAKHPPVDLNERILVTHSSQDLRAFTQKGVLIGRLEPEHVVNGIKAYCVSVYQRLLFCLCERDRMRVFCMRKVNFPLVYEFSVKNPTVPLHRSTFDATAAVTQAFQQASMMLLQQQQQQQQLQNEMDGRKGANKINRAQSLDQEHSSANPTFESHNEEEDQKPKGVDNDDDIGLCCALLDIAPSNSLRIPKFHRAAGQAGDGQSRVDPRGEPVMDYIECLLLIGLTTGSIMFLDLLNHFEVVMNFQAINGCVLNIKYRRRLKELIVFGKDYSRTYTTIRIWKLPDMECIGEICDLKKICCFSPSWNLNYFALGCLDGSVRLFTNHFEDKKIDEVVRMGESHDHTIVSICFLDDLRVYVTCSVEGKVSFWDFEKRRVKSIQLNIPTCGIAQNGAIGDVVMAQNHYLLTIPKRIWDQDDALSRVKLVQVEDPTVDLSDEDSSVVDEQARRANGDEAARSARRRVDPDDANSDAALVSIAAGAFSMPTNSQVAGNTISASRRESSVSLFSDRKSQRRMSKVNVAASATETRRKSFLRSSFKASSMSTLLSGDAEEAKNEQSESKPKAKLNLEDIERQLVIPALSGKQFEYISVRSTSPDRNGKTLHAVGATSEHRGNVDAERAQQVLPSQSMLQEFRLQQEMSKSMVDDGQLAALSINMSASVNGSLGDQSMFASQHLTPAQAGGDVLDVLHPRFLVHKKPPARVIQMEEIGSHVAKIVQLTSGNTNSGTSAGSPGRLPASNDDAAKSLDVTAKMAQLGMSPRARMTLLNVPSATGPSPSKPLYPPPSSRSSLSASRAQGLGQESGIDDLVANKAREQLMLDLTLGTKVSNEYKQHRSTLSEQRQQRFSTLKMRSSICQINGDPLRLRRTANISVNPASPQEEIQEENSEHTESLSL